MEKAESRSVPIGGDGLAVMQAAREEARRLGHAYLGTEHLLVGVLRSAKGSLGDSVRRLNLDPSSVAEALERIIGTGEGSAESQVLSPLLRECLDTAWEEAKSRGEQSISPGLMLLALCEARASVAYRILTSLGQDPALIAQSIRQML